DIEPLDLGRAVGDALGLAGTPAHIGAGSDAALDQLLAVWCIGSLVIGRVECGLVIIEEHRRALFPHRTPAICTPTRRVIAIRAHVGNRFLSPSRKRGSWLPFARNRGRPLEPCGSGFLLSQE